VERNAKNIAERLMKERKHSYARSWIGKFGIELASELVE